MGTPLGKSSGRSELIIARDPPPIHVVQCFIPCFFMFSHCRIYPPPLSSSSSSPHTRTRTHSPPRMPPTYCPCNKPILKRRSTHDVHAPPSDDLLHIDPSVLGQPTVHFPPHATLVTRTFLAHPRDEYDRSPIVVAPNACRLPERGCPGRTYRADSPSPVSPRRRPRSPATRRTHGHGSSVSVLPPLVPDLTSSSSDESDGCLPVHVGTVPHSE